MVNIVTWVQTQNQEELAEIRIKAEATPKTPLFKVLGNLEKAYHKDDIEKLVFWLAYAKFYELPVTKGREFFKKIEKEWPSSHCSELANEFHFLNAIYSERYTERNNSAQMYNYPALLAKFSRV
jgi:hypothetical protein